MAVLIEGIEMPKHDDEYVIFTVYGDGSVVYGPLNRPHVRYKNRTVHVPEPHGRLIDVDKVLDGLAHNLGIRSLDYLTPGERAIVSWFRDAPTIIPASEEGE